QILVEWNATGKPERPRCVHHLFEQQAAQNPGAVAVIHGEQCLCYGEVNARANHVAHQLRSLGVGPDGLVGLCLDRTPDLLVGILGILKAGGAYVPLDPLHPADRLAFILADTRAPVVLTQRCHRGRFDGQTAHVISIDADPGLGVSDPKRSTIGTANDVIYVIYTSGSTGQPKGVAVEHCNVYQLVRWAEAAYSPAELSRVLFGMTVSFDMAVFEIFLPLCLG